MLIKYEGQGKFIFVANSKSASSSIEASKLSTLADVRLTNAYAGKHMSIQNVHERFDFLFRNFPFESFFKFAVIRDPLEWVVSWYNFRSRPSLKSTSTKGKSNYVGNLSFAEFWEQNKGEDFLRPQSSCFVSPSHPHVRVNYIINQETFAQDFSIVEDVLNLGPIRIPKKNRSLSRITANDIPSLIKADILSFYHADYELFERLSSFNTEGIELYRAMAKSETKVERSSQRSLQDLLSIVQYRLGVMLQRS